MDRASLPPIAPVQGQREATSPRPAPSLEPRPALSNGPLNPGDMAYCQRQILKHPIF